MRKQTSETALLYLQRMILKLQNLTGNNTTGGRVAVVLPDETLFGDGICARIKEELLAEFNLDTVMRLQQGIFAANAKITKGAILNCGWDVRGPQQLPRGPGVVLRACEKLKRACFGTLPGTKIGNFYHVSPGTHAA